jgi:exopolysaccharide biosynthesis protein
VLTPPISQAVLAFDSTGTAHIGRFTMNGQTLKPFHPREAVGGRPQIVADSMIITNIDSAGGHAFSTTHHPRTAAGISRDGRHLILVVVDGRQMPYADGMSLRSLATLMLSLGAYNAINLDGGGSSTMLYADSSNGGALRIANRPSDKEGERTVGDALAIIRECRK